MRGRDPGLRTYALVGVGAALFLLVGKYGFENALTTGLVVLDPSREAAQVVTGVGFLGSALIIKRGEMVRGLTTAATVWVTAAIGMGCAVGLPVLAVAVTAAHFIVVFGYTRLRGTLGLAPGPSPLETAREPRLDFIVRRRRHLAPQGHRLEPAGGRLHRFHEYRHRDDGTRRGDAHQRSSTAEPLLPDTRGRVRSCSRPPSSCTTARSGQNGNAGGGSRIFAAAGRSDIILIRDEARVLPAISASRADGLYTVGAIGAAHAGGGLMLFCIPTRLAEITYPPVMRPSRVQRRLGRAGTSDGS